LTKDIFPEFNLAGSLSEQPALKIQRIGS